MSLTIAANFRVLLLLSAILAAPLAAQLIRPPNGDFESGPLGAPAPSWNFASSGGPGFTGLLTGDGCQQGAKCVVITGPANPVANSFGVLSASFPGSTFARRRIRYRAAVRVEGAAASAQMWLRVDRTGGGNSFFDNMGNRPIRSGAWAYYNIEAVVGADTLGVVFGVFLTTPGKAFFDDVTFEVLGDVRSETPEGPRPLSDTGLENVYAFARLAGYVRYFHPSDQAAELDWETFIIEGARKVEDAASPAELAERFQSMFGPIAPTLRVFPDGEDPPVPPELKRSELSPLRLARWAHAGIALESASYQSRRLFVAATGDTLPAGYVDPASPYEAQIGAGLTVRLPVSLYADSTGTLPKLPNTLSTDIWQRTVSDRATRFANVIITWNLFQHFYPNFDVFEIDTHTALRNALRSAAENEGPADFAITMRRLVATTRDGHGSVTYSRPAFYGVPLVWAMAGEQLIIARIKDAQDQNVQRGDRVLSIDGRDIDTLLAEVDALQSGATPQWIRWRTMREIVECNATRTMQLEIEPYAALGTRRTVRFNCRANDTDSSEPRPDRIADLEPGIVYVDLDRVTLPEWNAALPRLEKASGIVFDLRGYPRFFPPQFIQYMTETTVRSEIFIRPTPAFPDQANITWQQGGWTLAPLQPYLTAKRVFLIDARAISQAETDMDIIEHYKLAEFVGEPTAGTTGEINPFNLPGGFRVNWTGMRVLKPDGSRFHGVGIQPTVPTPRTRQGIAANRDEILLRGIEVVKGLQ